VVELFIVVWFHGEEFSPMSVVVVAVLLLWWKMEAMFVVCGDEEW
jgi:hypothetical protein